MKKLFLILAMLFSTLGTYSQELVIPFNDLPNRTKSFLLKYYNDTKYANPLYFVEYDGYYNNKVDGFVVKFENGTVIDFEKNGSLESIYTGVADTITPEILPKKIRKSFKKINPRNRPIVGLSIDRDGFITEYEIEISSGVEIIINTKGNIK